MPTCAKGGRIWQDIASSDLRSAACLIRFNDFNSVLWRFKSNAQIIDRQLVA